MAKELTELRAYAEANGGITAVAAELGISKAVLWAWINRGQVPAEHCPAVSQKTGISRMKMRPDDWHMIWPELATATTAAKPDRRAASSKLVGQPG